MRKSTIQFSISISAALLALAVLALGPQPAQAAVTEAWVHPFSNVLSNSVDRALKVVRDPAGDIIVTGTTDDKLSAQDMLTIKYSGGDGSVIWRQRYNGPESGDDVPKGVAVDPNGNVAITGTSSGSSGKSDYYTAKYASADGALLWEKRYDGPGSDDEARAVAVDNSGNVMITGSSDSDYYTAKYAAPDGALLWEKRGPVGVSSAVRVDNSGNVVVTGSSSNGSGSGSDYYTAKYAATDGALLWEKRYNGPANRYDQATAVAVDGSGNVIVTGYSHGGASDIDYYTTKYAGANGVVLWEKRYNSPANNVDYAYAVVVDGSGNVVVTGESFSDKSGYDYYTAKYASADGTLLWEQRYDGPVNHLDRATALALDGNGNVIVTGNSTTTEVFQGWLRVDYYTAKYAAADGNLIWENRYKSLAFIYYPTTPSEPPAVVADGAGNVIMTGPSAIIQGKSDYYAVKYAASDGALLWENNYNNGPVHHESHPDAIAMDRGGNVVVTATSDEDSYTAKYAASDGALLWEKRGAGNIYQMVLDGSGNVVVTGSDGTNAYITAKYAAGNGAPLWEKYHPFERPSALALDGSGNVVMVGSCFTNNYDDYYTAKYRALDGVLLWEKRYNGPANHSDQATAVAVDASGNVVVTGSSSDRSGVGDYYTAKYAAADGVLLWEKRYNGPANRDDRATAVVVDASGNVVVAGRSARSGSVSTWFIYDCYTVKYAAADGTLLWEKRDNDPNGAMAIDSSGNVVVTKSGATLKYAAADGALLWEKRFIDNGYATAMAVDDNSNVVVTEISGSNLYTAKYATADGALLWEKTYSEPGSLWNFSYAHKLALGPNGSFAITGSSNLGATLASDVLTVVFREGLPALAIEPVSSGVRLAFTGKAGQSYSLQRAPAVTGPWNTINSQTAPASGLLEYLDTHPYPGSGFYRTAQP